MKKNFVKKLAVALSLAMTVSTLAPAANADAAAAPAFKSYRTTVYENGTNNGSYTYTVKNIKKNYTVKWSVTGDGKAYVKASKASTKASKTTVSNTIKVATNGAKAAKNAKATVTAKVYNTKNKLVKTIKDAVTVKVQATNVVIKAADGSNFATTINAKYDLNRTLTPSNSTSKTYWSVEPSEDATIDSQGVLTATKAGEYTVTATVKNSKSATKVLATATQKVTVKEAELTAVQQTASNAFTATFTSDASKKVTKDSITVSAAEGNTVLSVKSVEFAADGITAKVTTYGNFTDGTLYNVVCGDATVPFTAVVGAVTRIAINTASAQQNVETPIDFTLFDAAGIDVTPSIALDANCIVTITGSYSGANVDKASKASLTMDTIGATAEVTVTYNSNAVGAEDVVAKQTITCIDPKAVAGTKLFVASSDVNAKSQCAKFYKGLSDTTIAVGENKVIDNVFFCAKDENGDVISYDSYEADSSNDDVMSVSVNASAKTGKFARFTVNGNSKGNAQINITATKNGKNTYYTIPVVVSTVGVAVRMEVSVDKPIMSNVNDSEYSGKITATLLDALGNKVAGSTSYEVITTTNGTGITVSGSAIYAQGAQAKTYTIKVTGADNETGDTFVKNVNVTVRELPDSSVKGLKLTYQIELNSTTLDQNPEADGDKFAQTRLYATYNGLFAGYVREVADAITVAEGNVTPSDDTKLTSVNVFAKFGTKKFAPGTNLIGESSAVTGSSIGVAGNIGATAIKFGIVDYSGTVDQQKNSAHLAKTGAYTIEYELTLEGKAPTKKTVSFTVKNTVVVPTVTVISKVVKSLSDDDILECLKTNVDMNNNDSEHASITVPDNYTGDNGADATNKTVNSTSTQETVKYVIVTDNYGDVTWNFYIPINTTFRAE